MEEELNNSRHLESELQKKQAKLLGELQLREAELQNVRHVELQLLQYKDQIAQKSKEITQLEEMDRHRTSQLEKVCAKIFNIMFSTLL